MIGGMFKTSVNSEVVLKPMYKWLDFEYMIVGMLETSLNSGFIPIYTYWLHVGRLFWVWLRLLWTANVSPSPSIMPSLWMDCAGHVWGFFELAIPPPSQKKHLHMMAALRVYDYWYVWNIVELRMSPQTCLHIMDASLHHSKPYNRSDLRTGCNMS